MAGCNDIFRIDEAGVCDYGPRGMTGLGLRLSKRYGKGDDIELRMSHDAGRRLLQALGLDTAGRFRWLLYGQLVGHLLYVNCIDGRPVSVSNPMGMHGDLVPVEPPSLGDGIW